MSGVNRNEVTRNYRNVFLCLVIAATAINVISVFVPIFKLWGYSETGIWFVFFSLSKESVFLSGKNAGFWGSIISTIALCMLVWNLIEGAVCIKNILKNDFDEQRAQGCKTIYTNHFVCITVYMSVAYFLCFVIINDFSLDGVKSPIIIPWIFQLAVFITGKYLFAHMNRAIAGEVEPINISFGGIFAQASHKNTSPSTTEVNENDKIELLKKYKELLDNGIITEEEYNEKKKSLL